MGGSEYCNHVFNHPLLVYLPTRWLTDLYIWLDVVMNHSTDSGLLPDQIDKSVSCFNFLRFTTNEGKGWLFPSTGIPKHTKTACHQCLYDLRWADCTCKEVKHRKALTLSYYIEGITCFQSSAKHIPKNMLLLRVFSVRTERSKSLSSKAKWLLLWRTRMESKHQGPFCQFCEQRFVFTAVAVLMCKCNALLLFQISLSI